MSKYPISTNKYQNNKKPLYGKLLKKLNSKKIPLNSLENRIIRFIIIVVLAVIGHVLLFSFSGISENEFNLIVSKSNEQTKNNDKKTKKQTKKIDLSALKNTFSGKITIDNKEQRVILTIKEVQKKTETDYEFVYDLKIDFIPLLIDQNGGHLNLSKKTILFKKENLKTTQISILQLLDNATINVLAIGKLEIVDNNNKWTLIQM